MGLDQRPYIGTWKLSGQSLIAHTPDALVYINGDLAVPGCQKCSGKIDIQKFLTEVSVDAGTEAGSHSATFSLSIPLHHTESFARDAKFILRPGLEVHIYMRGYFPVKGLFSTLAEKKAVTPLSGSTEKPLPGVPDDDDELASPSVAVPPELSKAFQRLRLNKDQQANAELIYQKFTAEGYTPAYASAAIIQSYGETKLKNIVQSGGKGPGLGLFQLDPGGIGKPTPNYENGKKAGTTESATTYNALNPVKNIGREIQVINNSGTARAQAHKQNGTIEQGFQQFFGSPQGKGHRNVSDANLPWHNAKRRYTRAEWEGTWDKGMASRTKVGKAAFGSAWDDPNFNRSAAEFALKKEQDKALPPDPTPVTPGLTAPVPFEAQKGEFGPSLLDEVGLAGQGVEDALAYPYYHVFHGVITQVNHSYSGGVSTVSVSCNSMLHFWQYHNMSTNASVFGARPTNSKLKTSLVGNNFTGMHPYAIMYSLHYDMAGAAGEVGFALSSKSNQTAVSEDGESLFSLNVQYWEKRFKRGTKLRMHGATGELFSTMAAAWLSRKSSSQLTNGLKKRYNTDKPFSQTNIGSQMVALGLYGGPNVRAAIDATQFAAKSQPSTSAKFEVNILEMQAFVSNIGDWGQVNLFESTYESKLDIANKVCGVTGFEFYQDVDGDFVFKPPMWNLDTSSSRVYRLEDIDIINIAFAEKEPQVTYMTVKGEAFKGITGTGTVNEWGVRGQYLDYRLIAQFGWRPGSYETSYFNDPKSMFFAAVNRMDVLNIAVNTASVTIPVRPEFRPGYPVYIPYLDCFYYCNSFAHSHSVGGQCTTALQLVGKRAKFFAPGQFRVPGIGSIDLGDTKLPEKPLQVIGTDGKPRLSGFPNVVMAMDPTAINPLFLIAGMNFENMSDPHVIKYMLDVGSKPGGPLTAEKTNEGESKRYYTITRTLTTTVGGVDQSSQVPVRFFFDEKDMTPEFKGIKGTGKGPVKDTAINIGAGAVEYMQQSGTSGAATVQAMAAINAKKKEVAAKTKQMTTNKQAIDRGSDQAEALGAQQDELDLAIRKLLKEIEELGKAAADASTQREKELNDFDKNAGYALLLEVYKQVSGAYRASADFQGNTDLSSSINLLDMLSDKKSTFSNGQQPGQYRYYSASHPDPQQQGPKSARYDKAKGVILDEAPLTIAGDDRTPPTVDMYVKNPAAPFPGAVPPEAELKPGQPVAGIRVLTSNPKKESEVYATSEITELMFTVQDVATYQNVGSSTATSQSQGMAGAAAGKVRGNFTVAAAGQNVLETIQGLYKGQWDKMAAKTKAGIDAMVAAAKAATPSFNLTGLKVPVFPTTVHVGSNKAVPTTVKVSEKYKHAGDKAANADKKESLGPQADKLQLTGLFDLAGASVAASFTSQSKGVLKAALNLFPGKDQAALRESLQKAWGQDYVVGAAAKTKTVAQTVAPQTNNRTTYSPVFPVSDEKGYHVVGSYRYGRGVNIDPEGVFDQLHKHDIFSLLDKNLVDQILRFFVLKEGNAVQIPEETVAVKGSNPPKKKVVPVQDKDKELAAKAQYLNDEALRQLRAANLTDKQILDFSAALNKGSKPNQLEFSLANMFSDTKLDGVQKVPVINAAYSLADLNIQQAGQVCNCKAAEAQMQLAAFGQEEFVNVTQAGPTNEEGLGTGTGNAATRFVTAQMEQVSSQWEQQQQAYRGQVLDRGGSHVVSSFLDTLGIDSGGTKRPGLTDQARAASAAAKANMDQALSKVSTLKGNLGTSEQEDK